jgi:hypothetical protein
MTIKPADRTPIGLKKMGHSNLWQMLAYVVKGVRADKAVDAQAALGPKFIHKKMPDLNAGDTWIIDFPCRLNTLRGQYFQSLDEMCKLLVDDLIKADEVHVVLITEAYHLTPPEKQAERNERKKSRSKYQDKKTDKPELSYDSLCELKSDGLYRADGTKECIYFDYLMDQRHLVNAFLLYLEEYITARVADQKERRFIIDNCKPHSKRTPYIVPGEPVLDLPDAVCLSGEGEFAAVGWLKHLTGTIDSMNTTFVIESTDSDALQLMVHHYRRGVGKTVELLWRFLGGGCFDVVAFIKAMHPITPDQFIVMYFMTGCDYVKKSQLTPGVNELDVALVVMNEQKNLTFDNVLRAIDRRKKITTPVKLCRTACISGCGCVRAAFDFFTGYCDRLYPH